MAIPTPTVEGKQQRGSIEDFFDVVGENLKAFKGRNNLNYEGFQPNKKHAQSGLPRIVVSPIDDTFGPPLRIGRNPKGKDGVRTRMKPIYGVNQRVEARIWDIDTRAVECLRDDFIQSCHEAGATSFDLVRGVWDSGGATDQGIGYRLELEVKRPIVKRPKTTVHVSTMSKSSSIE